jgi:hypothetical protein
MREQKLEVGEEYGDEFKGTYIFKEMFWAKKNRIIQKYTQYSGVTGEVVKSDYIAIQAESIMGSLHCQPANKPISLERLLSETEGIPGELGERFARIVESLNSVGKADLRFLLAQLSEKDRTELLQSLGYAKSSVGHLTSLPDNRPKQ